MTNKFYAAIKGMKENGDHSLKRCSSYDEANKIAQEEKGEVWEFDKPLEIGEDHRLVGKLIKSYIE